MYEGLNSPSIHTPHNLAEYSQTVLRYPNARIWAGGTNIMTRPDAYPTRITDAEIVYLGSIEELKKVSRNDRIIEVGSTVTLNEIYHGHRNYIPPVLKDNILSFGSPMVSELATIGGSIAASAPISTIPGTLITLGATAEVKYVKKKTVRSRWIPISLMLNESKDGQITLPPRSLITRVRASIAPSDYSYFHMEGSYIDSPDDTVAVAFTAQAGQENIINPHLAITFPGRGIVYSKDLDNIMIQLHFPLLGSDFSQFLAIVHTFVNAVTPGTSRIQRSRLNHILEDMVNRINTDVLAPEESQRPLT